MLTSATYSSTTPVENHNENDELPKEPVEGEKEVEIDHGANGAVEEHAHGEEPKQEPKEDLVVGLRSHILDPVSRIEFCWHECEICCYHLNTPTLLTSMSTLTHSKQDVLSYYIPIPATPKLPLYS